MVCGLGEEGRTKFRKKKRKTKEKKGKKEKTIGGQVNAKR